MQNSFKNFTDNEDIDDSVKSVIKFFAALFYLIPIIGPVAAIVGVAVASRSQSDDAPRTVGIVILVVAVIVGAMWIYDSKMVGNVNGYIPRPLQFAFLDAVKAQKG